MKYIKRITNSFKQNKKRNIFTMIIITILLICILFINMIYYSIQQYTNNIEDSIELRKIYGIRYLPEQYDPLKEKIEKIEHVEMCVGQTEKRVFAVKECTQFKNLEADGIIELGVVNAKICPEVIKGRKLAEDDFDSIIIPSNIYANSEAVDIDNPISDEEYVKGDTLLNKDIEIQFKTDENKIYTKSFKVVGIFDSDKYQNTSMPYITEQTAKKINEEIGYFPDEYYMEIVVDNFKNIENVENELYNEKIISNDGIINEAQDDSEVGNTQEVNFATTTHISIQTQRLIEKIMLYMLIIIIVILISILLVTNVNKSYISKTEIAILKVEGYTNKEIQRITIFENIIVFLISMLLAFIGFEILKFIMNYILNCLLQTDILNNMNLTTKTIGITAETEIKEQIYYLLKIPQKINWIFISFTTVMLLFIDIINTFFINRRILNKNIADILK